MPTCGTTSRNRKLSLPTRHRCPGAVQRHKLSGHSLALWDITTLYRQGWFCVSARRALTNRPRYWNLRPCHAYHVQQEMSSAMLPISRWCKAIWSWKMRVASATLTSVPTQRLVQEGTPPTSTACVPTATKGRPALRVRRTLQSLTAVSYCARNVRQARCGKLANGCTPC